MTRKILTFIFVAITCFAATASNTDDDTPYVKLMSRADSAIAKGDWSIAENALRQAIKTEPANPANLLLLSNLGMMQFYQGQDSLALETLTRACDIAPRSVQVLANRATVLEATGKTDEAVRDCNSILEIDSTYVRARAMRLFSYLRNKEWQAAQNDLDILLKQAPDNIMTNIADGTLYSSTGRYAEAITPFSKVIEMNPQAEYYAARAFCRIMTDNINDASQDIAEGLRINPLEGELYLYRAMLNKMRYRAADAKADAERAIQLGVPLKRAQPYLK